MCQLDAMTMVGEGRWYAAEYLKSKESDFPEIAGEVKIISGLFKEESGIIQNMAKILEGFGMGERQAKNLAIPEKREEIARLISKVAEKEKKACEVLEGVLNRL